MNKKELRKELKIAEANYLASANLYTESQIIFDKIAGTEEFKSSRTILLYMSIPGEVLTQDFINHCISIGKNVVLPKVEGSSLSLRLYSPGSLVTGYKGILEPSDDAPIIKSENIDLAIIPGLGFCNYDNKIYRLGRGGGFYDRLIPKLNCPIFGVAYPFRLIKDIPLDEWDMSINQLFISD